MNYKHQSTDENNLLSISYVLFSLVCVLCSVFFCPSSAHAKVYIDITSPALRKLPISISYTGPERAKEIPEIIKNDLDFAGIFYFIDPDILGAEITAKISVETAEEIKADVTLFDLINNKEVFRKKYTASRNILRTLAHSISDDIFKEITGREGIFRTKIAYIVSSYGKNSLHMMDWDGYNQTRVISIGLTLSHIWSPDSQYIVYSSERNKMWEIYSLNLRNYREMTLFSSKGINLVGGISHNNQIAFSSSKDGSPEIYVMNLNGSGSKKLTKSLGIDVSPVFSPDGSQIAFVSDRGGTPQIYIMDSDGTRIRRLTFEGVYNTSPAWSPDGKWVAFVGRKNGNNQIFMIKSDSTDLRQLTENGNNENPTFSPDGMFIAFDSDRDGSKGIYLMSINGERQKRITPKDIKAMNPKWSPYLK